MCRQATKKEALEITLRKFEKSPKGENDYIELFVVFKHATKGKDGLSQSEVEEIIKHMIAERNDQDALRQETKS